MRVIAGRYGGRRLQAPPGDATRPTSDRVREALFSILGDRVEGARVLDLFAGSGALGLEALSRGAARRHVRGQRAGRDPGASRPTWRPSARRRKWSARTPCDGSAARPTGGRQYDLVFLDPPYRRAGELGAPLSAALPPVLAEGALVVAEADRRAPLELTITATDERRYGDTLIRLHAP